MLIRFLSLINDLWLVNWLHLIRLEKSWKTIILNIKFTRIYDNTSYKQPMRCLWNITRAVFYLRKLIILTSSNYVACWIKTDVRKINDFISMLFLITKSYHKTSVYYWLIPKKIIEQISNPWVGLYRFLIVKSWAWFPNSIENQWEWVGIDLLVYLKKISQKQCCDKLD